VWDLSRDSAGLCVRFVTGAASLSVRWKGCKPELAKSHMAASGVSGLALYARSRGQWPWLSAARPDNSLPAEKETVSGLASKPRRLAVWPTSRVAGTSARRRGTNANSPSRAAVMRAARSRYCALRMCRDLRRAGERRRPVACDGHEGRRNA
jgi:hypothetical protein